MRVGDTVQWTFKDENGQKAHHTGIVQSVDKERIELKVDDVGVISVPLNDGTFKKVAALPEKPVKKVAAKAVVAPAPKQSKQPKQATKTSRKRGEGPSTFERVAELYVKLVKEGITDRPTFIKRLSGELGIPETTASTYLAKCKREIVVK